MMILLKLMLIALSLQMCCLADKLAMSSGIMEQVPPSDNMCSTCCTKDFNASLLHPTIRCLPYEVIKQKLQEEFQPPNENEIKQERIETVRMAIEKMLRKYHPQNVSQQDRGSVREEDIPRWILHKEERVCQQKEEEDKTEELMTFARKVDSCVLDHKTHRTPHGNNEEEVVCIEMSLSNTNSTKRIKSAHLYLKYIPVIHEHGEPNHFQMTVEDQSYENGVYETPRKNHYSWKAFDVKNTLKAMEIGDSILKFKIVCTGCNNLLDATKSHIPFIHIKTHPFIRNKRWVTVGNDCLTAKAGSNVCCRKRLTVANEELDLLESWRGRVINTHHTINFCSGICRRSDNDKRTNANSRLLSGITYVDSDFHRNHYRTCCVPSKWSDLPILVYEGKHNLIQDKIPGMVVDECACS